MKKIAAVTDNRKTISAHFGRATHYVVYTIEEGHITDREIREKAGHRDFQHQGSHDHGHEGDRGHGFGKHSAEKHRIMFETIHDCEIVLARGMGQGAYQGAIQQGLNPIVTEIADIETAVQSVIDGTIQNHLEQLH